MSVSLRSILIEILQKGEDDMDAKDLLERTRDVLNEYETLNVKEKEGKVTAQDILDKLDKPEELSSMEKYLKMIQGANK